MHGFYDEKKLNAMSGQQSQALDDEGLDYDDILRQRGHLVVGQFGFVGRAILPRGPLWGRLSAGSGRLKGGCGHDWPPHKSN